VFGRGRHRRRRGGRQVADVAEEVREAAAAEHVAEPANGPYDEADAPHEEVARLDLGSVRLPVPDGAQLQVEMDPAGPVLAVHLLTERGRLTVTAFAAPRSEELWDEVCTEIVARLRDDGTAVEEVRGEWGREVHAVTDQMTLRFVGVDGPRWLLRGVAAGAAQTHDELVELLYSVLRDTVVVRGTEALPVRSPLPITLPQPLAEQLKQAAAAQPEQGR
jgi:Protein of unknown function (DUF3710)